MSDLVKTDPGSSTTVVLIDEDPPLYYASEGSALAIARATLKLKPDARVYVARVEWVSE